MSSKENYIQIKLIKKNGRLVPFGDGTATILQYFIDNMDENQTAYALFETDSSDGTNLQKARIHALIRVIANEQGTGFEETKILIKSRSGLQKEDGTYKSFADCSKEELSRVIFELERVCNFLNIQTI